MLKSFLILALAAGCQLAIGQDCVGVRGLAQAMLPTDKPLHDIDGWGGPVYLTLDTGEVLVGVFSGQDGDATWHAHVGVGKGGSYTFAFNGRGGGLYLDTFTTSVTNATYPIPNGHNEVGVYQGSHKIVSGTGRFINASGTILVRGTWMVAWPLADLGITPFGFWNPDITGTICNVLPATH